MPDLLLSLGAVPLRDLPISHPHGRTSEGWGCGANADRAGGHDGGDGDSGPRNSKVTARPSPILPIARYSDRFMVAKISASASRDATAGHRDARATQPAT